MCEKKGVMFTYNNNVETTHLNRSQIHLNRKEDSVLGRNLCRYLRNPGYTYGFSKKKIKSQTKATHPNSARHNMAQSSKTSENCNKSAVSSNTNFLPNAFPKTRGFAIAGLNIASLPKHYDELIILMLDAKFDILALYKTRLDNTISTSEMSVE